MKSVLVLILSVLFINSSNAQNTPVDFESDGFGADWSWRTFENDIDPELEIIDNPDMSGINGSEIVAKFTALQAGQPFAGCETMHGEDIGTYTIDSSNMIIRIMVWKSVISDVGIKLVRDDDWSLGEIKVANTLTEEWEQITFDFSSHLDLTFDQLVIFPDFDARSSDNEIYFDNVFGPEYIPSGIEESNQISLAVFPNPCSDKITIQTESQIKAVYLYNSIGELVFSEEGNSINTSVDLSSLNNGIYIARIETALGLATKTIIIN
ncbi:MAG: hypothetical protein ACI959_000953 [Limisphaerales bacterium]|jgi:hypothetical protein